MSIPEKTNSVDCKSENSHLRPENDFAYWDKTFPDPGLMNASKETEIGRLPSSWEVGPLGNYLSEAQYGISVKGGEAGNCPILRMGNQINGRISVVNLQFAEISELDLAKFRIHRGDILFNRTNSLDLVGRTAIFDLDGDYVFASYLIRLRTIDTVLDSFYLNLYLNAEATQRRLKSIASRAVSQSNISATRLRGFVVPVPPLSEQRHIAVILGLVQRAIEQQERLITLTTELKKTLLHKLFTEGLRGEPLKQTEIGPMPESWELVKLGSIVNFQTGKLNSNAATPDGKFPFFTCSQETLRIDRHAFDTEAILLSGNNAKGVYSVKYFNGKFNAYQRTYVITVKADSSLPYG